jgi:hypothetical protein
LILTADDLGALEMLPLVPPEGRAGAAPLLLPLNLCQPPLLDCGVVASEVAPRFGVAALTAAGAEGVPVVAPRTEDELVEPVTAAAAGRVAAGVLADRVIACLCCSNDT